MDGANGETLVTKVVTTTQLAVPDIIANDAESRDFRIRFNSTTQCSLDKGKGNQRLHQVKNKSLYVAYSTWASAVKLSASSKIISLKGAMLNAH